MAAGRAEGPAYTGPSAPAAHRGSARRHRRITAQPSRGNSEAEKARLCAVWAEGLVEFIDNPKHRRSKLVRLTRKGE